jgi:DNA polymerase III, epsilon subunit and related 3''-5'' exonucleases
MSYIVLDLEWNQAMSAKSSIFLHLPIHLRGEIIQIGAVKLNDDLMPGEEFQCDVKPIWFRKMHYKVKKLTGFDNTRLENGLSFPEAMEKFWKFCGPDCTFMTWGYDDFGIMEQNLIIHDMEIDWMGRWVNLQLIYNQQTDGDRNQKSLETAMEHFGIEQTRTAHDALGDAYNTALVCSHLNLPDGISHYEEMLQQMAHHVHEKVSGEEGPDPVEHTVSDYFNSKGELWAAPEVAGFVCPDCGKALEPSRWVNQGDKRYMAMAICEEHGPFLIRLRVRREENSSWCANRLVYRADESMTAYFQEKSATPRRRRRKKNADKKS